MFRFRLRIFIEQKLGTSLVDCVHVLEIDIKILDGWSGDLDVSIWYICYSLVQNWWSAFLKVFDSVVGYIMQWCHLSNIRYSAHCFTAGFDSIFKSWRHYEQVKQRNAEIGRTRETTTRRRKVFNKNLKIRYLWVVGSRQLKLGCSADLLWNLLHNHHCSEIRIY